MDSYRERSYERSSLLPGGFIMRAAYVSSALEDIPVDFFADPDGCWEYDQLAQVAGFDQAWGQLSIGALTAPYSGFPDGAAVVMFTSAELCTIALVDCVSAKDELSERRSTAPAGPLPAMQRTDVAA
jgi:hypothetical protein